MWEANPKLDKFLYVKNSPFWIRLLGALGFFSTLLATYGFIRFFNLNIWYWILLGPIALFFTLRKLNVYFLQSLYPKFNIHKHQSLVQNFWSKNNEPPVDVFLPWAGEELNVYEEVLKGVNGINYLNKTVYILDDKGSEDIQELATKYGYIYLSRPNKGEHKKAGNLQYGYDNSSGKYVLVLDADFIPHKDMLRDMIPYLELDDKIGILQSPQYFEHSKEVNSRSEIEYGGGNIVENFYRIDMPSRDRFKAAICVGTSAIYRKNAILVAGGTPKNKGSEDVQQGLMITNGGYYVKYLPLVLSIGKSPETVQSYFGQHNRWCAGSVYAILGEQFRTAKLGLIQRWIYLMNITYYLSEAFGILFSFHALALLYFHVDSLSLTNIVWFLPYAIYSKIIVPKTKINKSKWGTQQAAISNAFTYLFTFASLIFGKSYNWIPAGLKLNRAEKKYIRSIDLGIGICVLYIGLLTVILWDNPYILANYNAYPILFWSFYSSVSYVAFLFMASDFLKKIIVRELQISTLDFSVLSQKALAYVRTYTLPSFMLILFSTVTFNGYSVLQDPDVPTNVALGQISHNIAVSSLTLGSDSNTLLDRDINIDIVETGPEKKYVYEAKRGDSVTKLASKAVAEYSRNQGLHLSPGQINRVASVIAFYNNKRLSIGEEVVFDRAMLAEYISQEVNIKNE